MKKPGLEEVTVVPVGFVKQAPSWTVTRVRPVCAGDAGAGADGAAGCVRVVSHRTDGAHDGGGDRIQHEQVKSDSKQEDQTH